MTHEPRSRNRLTRRVYSRKLPVVHVDWSHGEPHMWTEHGITTEQASGALADPDALVFDPDPTSRSGKSIRILGYSPTAQVVLTIILVRREDEPGRWWGANGWRANTTDRRTYDEGTER